MYYRDNCRLTFSIEILKLCWHGHRTSLLQVPHCVPFGVTVHRYVEGRKWNTQGAPDLSPDFGSIPEYLSSYVVLFVFCFSTGKAMLAINKGLQRSVFFSLLPLRFPLLIFVISSVVWLLSFSFSLFLSHFHTHFPFNSLRIRHRVSRFYH